MAEFRFQFDSVEVSNPVNWRDVEITYKQDEALRGFFTLYTSVLEFVDTAYDALVTAYNTDVCQKITVDIDYRCSRFDAWSDLIDGEISIKDVEFDFCKKVASAEVVRQAIFDEFIDNMKQKIDPAGEYSATFDFPFQVYDTWKPTAKTASTSGNDAAAIFVREMFEEIIAVISDNNLGFVSSLFETNYTPQVIRIDITSAPAAGETIVLTLTDEWGFTHIYSTEAVASSTTTYDNFEKTLLLGDSGSPTKVQGEIATVTRSTVGGTTERFDCTLYFEASVVSLSVGSGAGTATIQTAFVEGEKEALYTTSDLIRMNQGSATDSFVRTPSTWGLYSGVLERSFTEFFQEMSTVYNLGFEFDETAPGVWEVRIEKFEYFLDPTPVLTIRSIKDIDYSINEDFLGGFLLIGKESDNEIDSIVDSVATTSDALLTFLEVPIGADCDNFYDLRQKKEFYALFGDTQYEDFENNLDIDYSYLTMGANDDNATVNAPYEYIYKFWDVGSGTFKTFYYQNVRYQPLAQLLWLKHVLPEYTLSNATKTKAYTVAGGFTYTEGGGNLTVAEGDGYTPLIAEFDRHISKTDFNSIINGSQITINRTDDPANDQDAFIVEIRHRLSDGYTNFKLSAKK